MATISVLIFLFIALALIISAYVAIPAFQRGDRSAGSERANGAESELLRRRLRSRRPA